MNQNGEAKRDKQHANQLQWEAKFTLSASLNACTVYVDRKLDVKRDEKQANGSVLKLNKRG
jgi:hypothetical protein